MSETSPVIGLLHPGEMGAALAQLLRDRGNTVLWASAGRSKASEQRAAQTDLEDAGTVAELARRSDVILSVCPPHAALEVADAVAGFGGMFVDANAVSPATVREVEQRVSTTFVDGSIIGLPPRSAGTTRLYLSGSEAPRAASLFEETVLDTVVLAGPVGAASALKMAYAGWTKGSIALLLAIRASALAEGVEEALLAEWALSLPGLTERSQRAAQPAAQKGWRWIGEMDEIASTLAGAGLPPGFHEAAADVFRLASEVEPAAASEEELLERVLAALLRHGDRADASLQHGLAG